MKRFLSFLALTLLEPILHVPAWAQLTTLGVGGIAAVLGIFTPPSITPQPPAYFNANQSFGSINNVLKTDGGSAGAFYLPSTPTIRFSTMSRGRSMRTSAITRLYRTNI